MKQELVKEKAKRMTAENERDLVKKELTKQKQFINKQELLINSLSS